MSNLIIDPFKFSAAPWTPASLPSLAVWYDADTAGDFTLSGSDITTWNDHSGNGRHLSNGTGTVTRQTNVQNGRAVARSGSSSNALSYTAGSSFLTGVTAILVGTAINLAAASSAYGRLLSSSDHVTADIYQLLNFNSVNFASTGGGQTAMTYDTWLITTAWVTGSSGALRLNGQGGSTDSVPINLDIRTIRLFADTLSSGGTTPTGVIADIGEVVLATAYTSTDRDKMEGYLAHRWGLQGSLPAGHPYKASPP